MGLGLYIFAALTLGAIIGALTYTINPDYHMVELMGINFDLPVAVWIVLPMFFLLVFTVFHMLFYSLVSYFKLKKWHRDSVTLDDALYWSLVHEPKEQKYLMSDMRGSAVLLGKVSLNILDNVEGLNPRLSKVVHLLNKIKSGEYVNLKDHKMDKVFNDGNIYLIQNRVNRLKSDNEFVEEVMKSSTKYSKTVQAEALEIFAQHETFVKARKYAKLFDAKNLHVMLQRVKEDEDDEMGLSVEVLNEFVEAVKLSCTDFLKVANVTKKHFTPDENLALFNGYQQKNPKAQHAYLYLLFEYELLDEVRAYLEEQGEDEFVKFRALYELKKMHKKFTLEDFIDLDAICK